MDSSENPTVQKLPAPVPVTELSVTDSEKILLTSSESLAENWLFFSGKKNAAMQDTWSLRPDPESQNYIIVCKGEPYGYIRTIQEFTDFEIGLEWRYPSDANGNSGILLYTSGEDRIWPSAIQVQLHQAELGATFPGGGAKTDNELRNPGMLSRPLAQWNECVVHSKQGKLTVTVNGQKVGEVTGCNPKSGAIALQSEGAEIHFRKIWVKDLSAKKETPTAEKSPASAPNAPTAEPSS